jgi:hypothetical protein
MSGEGAKRLGEKLLMEVEVEDLGSVYLINTRSIYEMDHTNMNAGVQIGSRARDQ